MKSLGIISHIDVNNRISVPHLARKSNGWTTHTQMEWFMDGNKLVLTEHKSKDKAEIIEQLEDLQDKTKDVEVAAFIGKVIKYIKE